VFNLWNDTKRAFNPFRVRPAQRPTGGYLIDRMRPLSIGRPRIELLDSRILLSSSISGTAYNDANANSTQDSGEGGYASVAVYADVNNDGIYEMGEGGATGSAYDGTYTISGLSAGTYPIGIDGPGIISSNGFQSI